MAHSGYKVYILLFFFNDTATTEIYTLSLHDALPISPGLSLPHTTIAPPAAPRQVPRPLDRRKKRGGRRHVPSDRKSTRLNSSHANISYAVFCLKKKKKDYISCVHHTFSYTLYYVSIT